MPLRRGHISHQLKWSKLHNSVIGQYYCSIGFKLTTVVVLIFQILISSLLKDKVLVLKTKINQLPIHKYDYNIIHNIHKHVHSIQSHNPQVPSRKWIWMGQTNKHQFMSPIASIRIIYICIMYLCMLFLYLNFCCNFNSYTVYGGTFHVKWIKDLTISSPTLNKIAKYIYFSYWIIIFHLKDQVHT